MKAGMRAKLRPCGRMYGENCTDLRLQYGFEECMIDEHKYFPCTMLLYAYRQFEGHVRIILRDGVHCNDKLEHKQITN